jgi:4-carboxymuconolactone decarboxylase
MSSARPTGSEHLLRGLAASNESSLRSVLAASPATTWLSPTPTERTLSPTTCSLVHLAALLAAGASTTSLRWAVELALATGAQDEEIVEVLATVACVVGSAKVVAAAPRLALAIGYDIEIEGWDGY